VITTPLGPHDGVGAREPLGFARGAGVGARKAHPGLLVEEQDLAAALVQVPHAAEVEVREVQCAGVVAQDVSLRTFTRRAKPARRNGAAPSAAARCGSRRPCRGG